ncbi:MAG: hypothetical protein SH821_06160 [Phototrophicales bacterium]|nr:hypothetical protein [Phototrophicales bacterium]
MGIFFFFLFALSLLGIYLAVRRQLASPGVIGAVGMIASIAFMTLYLLSFNINTLQGIMFGVVIGVIFAGATLATAFYFLKQERK